MKEGQHIVRLTQKEYLVLALWTCNQTVKQCAKYLALSDRTIENYRDRIRCKLGVLSSDELMHNLLLTDDYPKLIDDGRKYLLSYRKDPCELASHRHYKKPNIVITCAC